MIVSLIIQGSYFGNFVVDIVPGQVSHLRGLRRTYKTFIKKSRATPVLWQGPHSIVAVDVQNMLWCLCMFLQIYVNNSLMASDITDHVAYFIFDLVFIYE